MKPKNAIAPLAALMLAGMTVGCVIDDTGGKQRGQSNAPAANVPESGSPVRRESAADTLNQAKPASPGDADVKVEGQAPQK